jgi:hypothetical protein
MWERDLAVVGAVAAADQAPPDLRYFKQSQK